MDEDGADEAAARFRLVLLGEIRAAFLEGNTLGRAPLPVPLNRFTACERSLDVSLPGARLPRGDGLFRGVLFGRDVDLEPWGFGCEGLSDLFCAGAVSGVPLGESNWGACCTGTAIEAHSGSDSSPSPSEVMWSEALYDNADADAVTLIGMDVDDNDDDDNDAADDDSEDADSDDGTHDNDDDDEDDKDDDDDEDDDDDDDDGDEDDDDSIGDGIGPKSWCSLMPPRGDAGALSARERGVRSRNTLRGEGGVCLAGVGLTTVNSSCSRSTSSFSSE